MRVFLIETAKVTVCASTLAKRKMEVKPTPVHRLLGKAERDDHSTTQVHIL